MPGHVRATRRQLLAALPAAVISAMRLRAAGGASGADAGARLVLLGTGGGPSHKPERSAPAQAIVVGGAVYVIDCGDGVAR